MVFIKAALKGILIGVANVIPRIRRHHDGVHGRLLHADRCVTGLFKQFGKSVKTLLPYVIGALIGIVALASLLTYLFEN
jgi:putative membrane protein